MSLIIPLTCVLRLRRQAHHHWCIYNVVTSGGSTFLLIFAFIIYSMKFQLKWLQLKYIATIHHHTRMRMNFHFHMWYVDGAASNMLVCEDRSHRFDAHQSTSSGRNSQPNWLSLDGKGVAEFEFLTRGVLGFYSLSRMSVEKRVLKWARKLFFLSIIQHRICLMEIKGNWYKNCKYHS